jgi:hypothetical protein
VLTPEEHNDPLWDPDNDDHWKSFFMEHRLAELAHYEGSGPPPANKNDAMWKFWWGVRGRTIAWVLDHIATGNHPWLTMPQRYWMPRRMEGASSSSRSSSSMPGTPRASGIAIGSLPTAPITRLLHPKKEPGSSGASSAPGEGGQLAGLLHTHQEGAMRDARILARVKKEPGAPTPPSSKKARHLTEDDALQLEYQAPDDLEEFPVLKAVKLASFNEV